MKRSLGSKRTRVEKPASVTVLLFGDGRERERGGGGGGRGGEERELLLVIFGGCARLGSPNSDPILDQNI